MNLENAREYIASAGSVLSKATSFVSGDAQFFATAPKVDDLRVALASSNVHEKRDAMKRITAQVCRGVDMRHMFPDVVKNIHVPSIELRKLIYLYVVNYAEECPDEALLSISAFQKDLVDPSVHVRSLALRMLCSIRIPAIHPAVMVAVRKCASDSSALVRKTAAIGLYQMHVVCRGDADRAGLHTLLAKLMADDHPDVAGAAAMSFNQICPNAVTLLHPVYRHWCRVLSACEEAAQIVMLRTLLRYARTQFRDPKAPVDSAASADGEGKGDGHSSEESSSATSSSTASTSFFGDSDGDARHKKGGGGDSAAALHPDHVLLLNTAKPLLLSLNKAVVIAACAVLVHCGTSAHIDLCVRPLLRLHVCARDGQNVVLHVIYSLLLKRPQSFVPFAKTFYLLPNDGPEVRQLKLHILSHLVTSDNMADVAQEYRTYVRSYEVDAVVEAVRGISTTAIRNPTFYTYAVRLLPPLFAHPSPLVVSESVNVLRLLVMQGKDSTQTTRLIIRLMKAAIQGAVTSPHALATVLWLVGEKMDTHASMATAAPDLFRIFVKSFTSEEPEVKREVMYLGCRIWLRLEGTGDMAERFKALYVHVLELARFDENYAIREEARMLEAGVDRHGEVFAAMKATLLGDIPLPHATDAFAEHDQYELGTLSHLCGRPVLGYRPLPAWPSVMPDPSTRAAQTRSAASKAARHGDSSTTSSTSDSNASSGDEDEDDFYGEPASASDEVSHSSVSAETDSSNSSDDESSSSGEAPVRSAGARAAVGVPQIVIKRVQPTAIATHVDAQPATNPRDIAASTEVAEELIDAATLSVADNQEESHEASQEEEEEEASHGEDESATVAHDEL